MSVFGIFAMVWPFLSIGLAVACVLAFWGMLAHFSLTFIRFADRHERLTAATRKPVGGGWIGPALGLALVTWAAMVLACAISGISGVVVPTVMKKLGADPATASSIFLTTATDVVSMGTFLGLATLFLL